VLYIVIGTKNVVVQSLNSFNIFYIPMRVHRLRFYSLFDEFLNV